MSSESTLREITWLVQKYVDEMNLEIEYDGLI